MQAVANAGDKDTRKAAAGKVADLEKERLKSDAKLRSGTPPDDKSQAAMQKNIDANDRQYQDLEDRISQVYGLPGGATPSQTDAGVPDAARQKIQADPDYAGFRDAMRGRQNPVDVEQLDTQDLGELFRAFKDNQKKNVHASTMADEMRRNYRQ